MAFRFPQREPRDAKELFQWLRELLPDLEIKVLENCEVGTTQTTIPHGLGMVPFFVRCSTPHCIAVVRQVKKADRKNVYLRATNRCVVDVYVVKQAMLAQLTTSVKNGGYELPDWDPEANDDHLVIVDGSDSTPATLIGSLKGNTGISFAVVVDGDKRKVQPSISFPAERSKYPGPMSPIGEDFAGDSGQDADGNHSHPWNEPPVNGTIFYVCDFENGDGYSDPQSLKTALQPGYATRTSEVYSGSPDNLAIATTDLNIPGITALPAGEWLIRLYMSVDDGDSGDPAGPAQITCTLKRKSAGGTVLATLATGIATPDDSNPEWHYVDLTVTISAGAWEATDRICLEAVASTTSSDPVWVNLGCAGTHASFIRPPFVSVVAGGSLWHPDMGGRDLAGQHPWSAIGPDGRSHKTIGIATLTGSGTTRKIVMPDNCDVAVLDVEASEVIYGIDRTGFSVPGVYTSDEIRILVPANPSNVVTFVHIDVDMGGDAMFLGDTSEDVSFKAWTFVRFARDPFTGASGIWRFLGSQSSRDLDGWGTATLDAGGILTIPTPYRAGRLTIANSVTINGINPESWGDGQEATVLIVGASVSNVATVMHQQPVAENARLSLSRGIPAQFQRPTVLRFKLDAGDETTNSWLLIAPPVSY